MHDSNQKLCYHVAKCGVIQILKNKGVSDLLSLRKSTLDPAPIRLADLMMRSDLTDPRTADAGDIMPISSIGLAHACNQGLR